MFPSILTIVGDALEGGAGEQKSKQVVPERFFAIRARVTYSGDVGRVASMRHEQATFEGRADDGGFGVEGSVKETVDKVNDERCD